MKKSLLAIALLLTGCKDPYGNAAKLAQDVSVTINQAAVTVNQFRIDGSVSTEEARTILGYLDTLNNINKAYLGCIEAVEASKSRVGSFTACAKTLEGSMSNPTMLVALHVTNPQSQAKLTAVMQAIVTLIETTLTALNGK